VDNTQDGSDARAQDTSAPQWRVFVSSTTRGMTGFRDAARDVIDNFGYDGLKCFEAVMMEDFPAQADQAREVCARNVGSCAVLVGLLGIRYGSHPDDDQTSYTELEYQAAKEERKPRLMFLLEPGTADRLEHDDSQSAGQNQRQLDFRGRALAESICKENLTTEIEFREELAKALKYWIDEYSFRHEMVDHSAVFTQARSRLVAPGPATGKGTLIFGEPGTGKSKLLDVLTRDPLVRRSHSFLVPPRTVRLIDGTEAVQQHRTGLQEALSSAASQPGNPPAATPALVTVYLDTDAADMVDDDVLGAVASLFSWDLVPAVVLAETNNHSVRAYLRQRLLPAEAIVTVEDFDNAEDARELMHREAPSVTEWPEEANTLAEALGYRPIALRDVAVYIATHAGHSPIEAARLIREQLAAIEKELPLDAAQESGPAIRYAALIRNHVDHLSAEARDLLALMTVLHPKPTLFPDEMALALDMSLDQAEAIQLAVPEGAGTGEEEEEDEDEDEDEDEEQQERNREHRERAGGLVAELEGRGLLERELRVGRAARGQWRSRAEPTPLLTLHSTKRQVIAGHLHVSPDQWKAGHTRAEAFYRARIGQALSGSFDSHFRMEDGSWWDDVEEWIYHLGHIDPARARTSYATLFLDTFWWWDLYVFSTTDFCGRLVAYGDRPLVQGIDGMPKVIRRLRKFRKRYPPEYQATRTRVLAAIAGGDPDRDRARRKVIDQGAKTVPILGELCAALDITELDDLITGSGSAPADGEHAADPGDHSHWHLLGLLCLFLGEGHRDRAAKDPGGTGLETAERCYRRAAEYLEANDDSWDLAWAHYLLGEVISDRGGDPESTWDQATQEADAEDDTELRANIERARADHLRSHQDLEAALPHYGKAIFYAMALQITSNVHVGADEYTQALYREICLHALQALAEPLLQDSQSPPQDRQAEARRRLEVMLRPWQDAWEPDQDKLAAAFGSASRQDLEQTVRAIAAAAFPPEPDDAMLRKPDLRYYIDVRARVQALRGQEWATGLGRLKDWDKQKKIRDRAGAPPG
jgi:Domain of unknown function (DUF4062)